MNGWIAVKREIFDHEFFAKEPLTEREAWIWLCANAAWRDTKYLAGSVTYDVPRGSLFVTLRGLARAWRWKSEKRVRTFISRLESGRMVGRNSVGKGDARRTHLSICNYERYQNVGQNLDATPPEKRAELGRTKEQENNIPTTSGAFAPDPSRVVFGQCLEWLKSNGISETKARPILGKWRKAHGDEAVIAACGKGQREGAIDPVAYVEGVFRVRRSSREYQDAFGGGEVVQ